MLRNTRRRQRAPDEDSSALAHHPSDVIFRERRAAEFGDQLIRRVREVAAGIDDRAVEIECDQAV